MSILILFSIISVASTWIIAQQRRDLILGWRELQNTTHEFATATTAIAIASQGFVATGQAEYKSEYNEQLQAQQAAADKLRSFSAIQLSEAERRHIARYIAAAKAFTRHHAAAIASESENGSPRTLVRLLTADYVQSRATQSKLHGDLDAELSNRIGTAIGKLNRKFELSIFVAIIALTVNFFLIFYAVFGFYNRRVLLPLVRTTKKLAWLMDGRTDIRFEDGADQAELAQLNRTLDDYQKTIRELDRQRNLFNMSEAWYHHIIEAFPDGMLVVDDKGIITLANSRAHEIMGYAPHALLGMNVDLLVPPDIRPHHKALRDGYMSEEMRANNVIREGDFRAMTRTAEEIPVHLSFTHMPFFEGRAPCVGVAIRDIRERKQWEHALAERAAFQEVLLETIPYPVFYKDAEGRYLGSNRAFLDAFGVKMADIVGRTIIQSSLIPVDQRPMFDQANEQVLKHGGTYSTVVEMDYYADGAKRSVLYKLAAYHDSNNALAGLVGVLVDITAQKETERALAAAKAAAEDAAQT